MKYFTALGFHRNSSATSGVAATHVIEQMALRFHQMVTEFVQDARAPESDPCTFSKVKTLPDDMAIGGWKISDQEPA